jgi:hypothetical protein
MTPTETKIESIRNSMAWLSGVAVATSRTEEAGAASAALAEAVSNTLDELGDRAKHADTLDLNLEKAYETIRRVEARLEAAEKSNASLDECYRRELKRADELQDRIDNYSNQC